MSSKTKITTTSNFEELVSVKFRNDSFNYQYISNILDFNQKNKTTALVVDHLDPEYFLLFSHIKLIITRKGSILSHLSMLAREYGLSIIKSDFPVNITAQGTLTLNRKSKKLSFL